MTSFLLELAKRIDPAFFKPEVIRADEASWTMPVMEWIDLGRGVKAIFVIPILTAITRQELRTIVLGSTDFADLCSH